ncbi:hypothetical protein BESB_006710 [Besnoitia besnoiti]|uniref:Mediator complex subunit MED17 n=1 Tax=Besnoitia besnoiti TaxID=94643 RepID=A0A2A9MQK0_BESBE|nr:hypothetical protein BESB_006710 [Besnoitia besnoiti]PFH38330.1 hypothetical protein BESB_006710 [Besnoitia besnoiti]
MEAPAPNSPGVADPPRGTPAVPSAVPPHAQQAQNPPRPAGAAFQGAAEASAADEKLPALPADLPEAAPSVPLFSLEPYGAGDLRLLKFLADGRPAWEAPPARAPGGLIASNVDFFFPQKRAERPEGVQAEAAQAGAPTARGPSGVAGAEAFRAYLEKSAKASAAYPPLDLLQKAEALCVGADAAHNETLKESDPWVRNKGAWEEAVQKRDEASKWLSGGGMLFDLLLGTANAAPGQRFLRLVEAKDETDEDELWQKLLIGLQARHETSAELEQKLRSARQQMLQTAAGVPGQRTWLKMLRRLQRLRWVLVKKRYQDVEFSRSDASYPYVSEVYVHLLQVPARCWDPAMGSPVGCGLPLPPPRAFGDHFVLLKATLKDQTERGGGEEPGEDGASSREAREPRKTAKRWEFVLEYDEQAATAVETKSLLHINFRPLLSCDRLLQSLELGPSPSPAFVCPVPSTCMPPPAGFLAEEPAPEALSSPAEEQEDAEAAQASVAIHEHLQRAQWALLDRCCFQVLATQAERMRVLGERRASVAAGAPEGAASGGPEVAPRSPCERVYTAECVRVDSKSISILVRGVPVASAPRTNERRPRPRRGQTSGRESGDKDGEDASHSSTNIGAEQGRTCSGSDASCACAHHTLDFMVHISYAPSCTPPTPQSQAVAATSSSEGSQLVESSNSQGASACEAATSAPDAQESMSCPLPACSTCACCTMRMHPATGALLEQMQRVAVLQLRQQFLETWAYEAFEHPRLCGELAFEPPLLNLKTSRQAKPRGENLLSSFVSWVVAEGLNLA